MTTDTLTAPAKSNIEKASERFFKDIEKHVMTVELDNGPYRHIVVKEPGTNIMRFNVTTWPGHVTISGDMGSQVFQREPDMLAFFASRGEKTIDFRYFAEKAQCQEEVREWSYNIYREHVVQHLNDAIEAAHTDDDGTEPEWADELRAEVESDLLSGIYGSHEAMESINQWSNEHLELGDFYEYDCRELTYHTVWQILAVRWAADQYLALKTSGDDQQDAEGKS